MNHTASIILDIGLTLAIAVMLAIIFVQAYTKHQQSTKGKDKRK